MDYFQSVAGLLVDSLCLDCLTRIFICKLSLSCVFLNDNKQCIRTLRIHIVDSL
jgi:hypothetical protein